MEQEKQKEAGYLSSCQKALDDILTSAAIVDDDPENPQEHGSLGILVADLDGTQFRAPEKAPNNEHWEVQRAAAYASWCILGAYVDSAGRSGIPAANNMSGLEEYKDKGLDKIAIYKNKALLKASHPSELLHQLRFCFAGRLIPVPKGQPPSFLKTKLRVEYSG